MRLKAMKEVRKLRVQLTNAGQFTMNFFYAVSIAFQQS